MSTGADQERGVFIRLLFLKKNISDFLTAEKMLSRLTVWAQIGFAWGHMVPPLCLVCLVIIAVEIRCHHVARQMFPGLQIPQSKKPERPYRAPWKKKPSNSYSTSSLNIWDVGHMSIWGSDASLKKSKFT